MKQIINKILLTGLILSAQLVNAQNLQELAGTALNENYQILIYRNEAAIAANNNTAGNAGQLPSVVLDGTFSTSLNNTRQEFADGTVREGNNARITDINLAALVEWNVFNGFRVYAMQDQLGYLERLGQVNSKFYIEQTVADIAQAYYQMLRERLLLQNYEQSLEISAFRLNIEKKKKEVGSGTGMMYQQALVDYQTDSIRVLEQKNNIKSLEIEINRILNSDLERTMDMRDSSFSVVPLPSKDSLLQAAKNNNRQLKQQRLQELIAETNLRIENADRYPQINLFAGYQYSKTYQEVGFINSNRNYGPTAGINISFNLYNGGNTIREIENAEVTAKNSSLNRQQVTHNINANLLNYYYQYISVMQRIELASRNLESARVVYRIADEQLRRGAINGYDFRLTQVSLLNAANTLLQLEYTLKSLEINMNRISGNILEAYM